MQISQNLTTGNWRIDLDISSIAFRDTRRKIQKFTDSLTFPVYGRLLGDGILSTIQLVLIGHHSGQTPCAVFVILEDFRNRRMCVSNSDRYLTDQNF